MKYSMKMIIVIGIFLMCLGCDDNEGPSYSCDPDLKGTYHLQTTHTVIAGDCSNTVPDDSGSMTFSHQTCESFTVTACTYDNGALCSPFGFMGRIDGNQVMLQHDLVLIDQEWHTNMSGTVTDASNFILSGQGTKEPGACQFTITGIFTRL